MQIPHVASVTDLRMSGKGTPTAAIDLNFGPQQQAETTPMPCGFAASDPAIRADILKMIVQYLENERLFNAAAVLQDEANMKAADTHAKRSQSSRLRKAIFDGEWEAAIKFLSRVTGAAEQKKMQYYLFRQEYLELIDRQEYQRAFGVLTKRLKPLEDIANASAPSEFQELCYLLTCSSVHDTKLFKDWGNISSGREKLAERVSAAIDMSFAASAGGIPVPPDRLVALLQQAAMYQIEHSHPKPLVTPRVPSLLTDYQPIVLPNSVMHICVVKEAYNSIVNQGNRLLPTTPSNSNVENGPLGGHSVLRFHSPDTNWRRGRAVIKCTEFVSDSNEEFPVVAGGATDGNVYFWLLGSQSAKRPGASDNSWPAILRELGQRHTNKIVQHLNVVASSDTEEEVNAPVAAFAASTSTVWDLCTTCDGNVLTTAAGDGKVIAWKIRRANQPQTTIVDGGVQASVYATLDVNDGKHRERLEILRSELGSHKRDAYCVAMHPDDTHLASGGYDRVVHLFSLKSGEEIKTCTGHSAPVTQVVFNPYGNLVISSSRDGTIRFWDCLSGVCVRVIEEPLGELTSVSINGDGSSLLVCARFGSARVLDAKTGTTRTRLAGQGTLSTSSMYRPCFAAREQVVISGSDDGIVVAWDIATGQPVRRLEGHAAPVTRTMWYAPMSLIVSISLESTLRVWCWDPSVED